MQYRRSLLLRKNWLLKKRHALATMLEVALPFLFVLALSELKNTTSKISESAEWSDGATRASDSSQGTSYSLFQSSGANSPLYWPWRCPTSTCTRKTQLTEPSSRCGGVEQTALSITQVQRNCIVNGRNSRIKLACEWCVLRLAVRVQVPLGSLRCWRVPCSDGDGLSHGLRSTGTFNNACRIVLPDTRRWSSSCPTSHERHADREGRDQRLEHHDATDCVARVILRESTSRLFSNASYKAAGLTFVRGMLPAQSLEMVEFLWIVYSFDVHVPISSSVDA